LIINEEELSQGLDIVEEGLALVDAALSPVAAARPAEVFAQRS
jgi:hypothetical protein